MNSKEAAWVKQFCMLKCELKVQHCIDCQSSMTTESMNEDFSLHFSKHIVITICIV